MAVCEFARYGFVALDSISVGRAEVVAASSREEDSMLNNMVKENVLSRVIQKVSVMGMVKRVYIFCNPTRV
jgi:hypothetical protein